MSGADRCSIAGGLSCLGDTYISVRTLRRCLRAKIVYDFKIKCMFIKIMFVYFLDDFGISSTDDYAKVLLITSDKSLMISSF